MNKLLFICAILCGCNAQTKRPIGTIIRETYIDEGYCEYEVYQGAHEMAATFIDTCGQQKIGQKVNP